MPNILIHLSPFPRVCVLLFSALVAGCANPYMQNYVSRGQPTTTREKLTVLPPSGPPRLVTTQDPKADARNLRENGYILLGRSKFRGTRTDEKEALAQARKVKAEVVMVGRQFVKSATESVPISRYIPGETIETNERTVIQNGEEKPKVIDRTVTTYNPGEFHTTYVDQSTDYYDFSATYWAKVTTPVFGVHVKATDDALRASLGTNKGVLVRIVVKNSPAFDADLLRGDVLLTLANEEITGPDQFFDLVKKYEGRSVTVLLNRSGRNLTKEVAILKP